MTTAQVTALRAKINAAWNSNNRAEADKLQAKLHQHFAAQADKFMSSKKGQEWADRLMTRP